MLNMVAGDQQSRQPWYGGKMSANQAERLFDACPNGTFLVRDSESR